MTYQLIMAGYQNDENSSNGCHWGERAESVSVWEENDPY